VDSHETLIGRFSNEISDGTDFDRSKSGEQDGDYLKYYQNLQPNINNMMSHLEEQIKYIGSTEVERVQMQYRYATFLPAANFGFLDRRYKPANIVSSEKGMNKKGDSERGSHNRFPGYRSFEEAILIQPPVLFGNRELAIIQFLNSNWCQQRVELLYIEQLLNRFPNNALSQEGVENIKDALEKRRRTFKDRDQDFQRFRLNAIDGPVKNAVELQKFG